jgi:hypothetical protein
MEPAPGPDAAGDTPRGVVLAGCGPAGALAPPPGDRPGSPGYGGRDGAAPAAAGGAASRGLNRTVTVTNRE